MTRRFLIGIFAVCVPLACGGVSIDDSNDGGVVGTGVGGFAGTGSGGTGPTGGSGGSGGAAGSGGAVSGAGGAAGRGGSGVGGSGGTGGSAGAGGAYCAGTGPSASTGGSAGIGAGRPYCGSGGGAGSGGASGGNDGGVVVVDARCPNTGPASGGVCKDNGLRCSYAWNNGCLCAPVSLYDCRQVDPACPATAQAGAPLPPTQELLPPPGQDAPATRPDSGSTGAAPLPPVRQCACAGTTWSCLPN